MLPTTKGPIVPLAACLLLAVAVANGCSKPAARARETPAAGAPEATAAAGASEATSEAAKTRELEEKAAGYKDRYQEIQDSSMSAEEKALERSRFAASSPCLRPRARISRSARPRRAIFPASSSCSPLVIAMPEPSRSQAVCEPSVPSMNVFR